MIPSISLQQGKNKTTRQRNLLEEKSEALREALRRPRETTAWLPFTRRWQPLAQPSMRAVGSMEKWDLAGGGLFGFT